MVAAVWTGVLEVAAFDAEGGIGRRRVMLMSGKTNLLPSFFVYILSSLLPPWMRQDLIYRCSSRWVHVCH